MSSFDFAVAARRDERPVSPMTIGHQSGSLSRTDPSLARERFLHAVREPFADTGPAVFDVDRAQPARAQTMKTAVRAGDSPSQPDACIAIVSPRRRGDDADRARQFALLSADLYAEDDLAAVLRRITDQAVALIAPCDVASITFAGRDRCWTPSASGPIAEVFDRAQYRAGEGPCLDATRSPWCEMAEGWHRWPRLAESVPADPVRSVLSCRIATHDRDVEPERAALNLYSYLENGFDPAARDAALVLASHASVALAVAGERRAVERAEENFRQALASREAIGQAIGMLMEREQLSASDAFDVLRRASQRMNVKLREIAASITARSLPDSEKVRPAPSAERPPLGLPALGDS